MAVFLQHPDSQKDPSKISFKFEEGRQLVIKGRKRSVLTLSTCIFMLECAKAKLIQETELFD